LNDYKAEKSSWLEDKSYNFDCQKEMYRERESIKGDYGGMDEASLENNGCVIVSPNFHPPIELIKLL
jgi:hypothetical protein